MPLTRVSESPARWLVFVILFGITLGLPVRAQVPDDVDRLLEECWSALAGGEAERAAQLAQDILARTESDAEPFHWRDRLLLARAAALYELGQTREAAAVARAIDHIDPAFEGVAAERLPRGFDSWARGAAANATSLNGSAPAIALADLNPDEREVVEVDTHFAMDVEIVRIPVIVEDETGAFVTGLEREQFAVEDGTPPAEPIYQLIREDEPSSIGLLVDASDAAREHAPEVLKAVIDLVTRLRAEDEIFLLQFADDTRFLTDFAPGGEAAVAALADYDPGGRRALRDAVATGLIRMRQASHDKKSLVVVAFGGDDASSTDPQSVRRAAQRDGVSIHALLMPAGLTRWRPGQSDEAPTALVQRLAFETGGLVALRPTEAERFGGLAGWVEQAAFDIGGYIRHQYLLQYESVNPPPRGQWRDLRVRVAAPHKRVRARSGYVR